MGVVSGRAGVTSSITFTSGLDPNNRINQGGAGVCSGASSESGTLDVAPVTPGSTDVLLTRASLVNDKVSRHGSQKRSQGTDIVDLVVVGVPGSDRIRRSGAI